jgi:hypothetical protein
MQTDPFSLEFWLPSSLKSLPLILSTFSSKTPAWKEFLSKWRIWISCWVFFRILNHQFRWFKSWSLCHCNDLTSPGFLSCKFRNLN